MNKIALVIARHGHTEYNGSGESGERIRSWLNIPLDAQGRKDAQGLAVKLARLPIERIYSSDLDRALETAETAGDKLGLPVEPTKRLRPWGLGYIAGMPVSKALPLMARYVSNEDQKVPGKDGESFKQFRTRVLSFVHKCMTEAVRDQRVLLLVSHTRDLQCVKAWVANGHPPDYEIDQKVMDSYDSEIGTGGFLTLTPTDRVASEWKVDHGETEDEDPE